MSKTDKRILVVLVVLASFVGLWAIPVANADTVSITSTSYGAAQLTAVQKTMVVGMINGATQVKAFMPNGLPKSEQKQCFWGDADWGLFLLPGGKIGVKKNDHGLTHMCHCPRSKSITGLCQIGPLDCGNPVALHSQHISPPPEAVILHRIVVVKQWILTIHVTATVSMSAMVQGSVASAGCSTLGSASGTGQLNLSWAATGTNRAKLLAKATNAVTTMTAKAGDNTTLQLRAKGSAAANLSLQCSSTQTPPTTTPPPTQPPPFTCPPGTVMTSPGVCHVPPLFVSATRIQEVFVNEKDILLCATPKGDDVNSVTFTATTGSFLDGGQAKFNSAMGQWCDNTYAAPSEPPSAVTPVPLPNQGPYPNNNAPDTYDVISMEASTSDGLTTSANNYVLIRPQPQPPG